MKTKCEDNICVEVKIINKIKNWLRARCHVTTRNCQCKPGYHTHIVTLPTNNSFLIWTLKQNMNSAWTEWCSMEIFFLNHIDFSTKKPPIFSTCVLNFETRLWCTCFQLFELDIQFLVQGVDLLYKYRCIYQ